MNPPTSESGLTSASPGISTPVVHAATTCPSCHAPVEAAWRVCVECGASLAGSGRRPSGVHVEAALPSAEIGDTDFRPLATGAKRPITIVEAHAGSSVGPTVKLSSLVVLDRPDDPPPPEPPTEDSRKAVTFVAAEPAPPERAKAPEPTEVEPATEIALRPEAEVAAQAVAAPSGTNLSPTVLVFPQERSAPPRITREDLSMIERVVDEAVRRALREHGVVQGQVSLAGTAMAPLSHEFPVRWRAAAVGAGLLIGGTIADLVVLNWDIWIRGEAVSVVGGIQQLGLMGTAALAGAGAGAIAVALSRGRRAHARRRAAGAPTR